MQISLDGQPLIVRVSPITTTNITTNGTAPTLAADTIILCEGRGDYLTGLHWESDGQPEISGGDAMDAIRYTAAEAGELLESLGRGFSAEQVPS